MLFIEPFAFIYTSSNPNELGILISHYTDENKFIGLSKTHDDMIMIVSTLWGYWTFSAK